MSLVAIFASLYLMELHYLAAELQKISAVSIAALIVLNMLSILLLTIRWILIQRRFLGAEAKAKSSIIASYWSSYIYNIITPANLGGDLYRYLSLKGDGWGGAQVLEQLIQERLVGLCSILAVLTISLVCLLWIDGANLPYGDVLLAGSAIFSFATSAMVISPRTIFQKVLSLLPLTVWHFSVANRIGKASGISHFVRIFSLSFFSFIFWLFSIKVVCVSMSIHIPFQNIMFIGALVEVIRFVPLSVQGIGIREGIFASLFILMDSSAELGFAVGLIVYASLIVAQILFGILGKALLIKQHA